MNLSVIKFLVLFSLLITQFYLGAHPLFPGEQTQMCEAQLSVSPGQLHIDGIVGEQINLNVFDSNQTLVWTCNHWTGSGCNESETIDLQSGEYFVAIQSSLCSFYESIFVSEAEQQEYSCGFLKNLEIPLFRSGIQFNVNENIDGIQEFFYKYSDRNYIMQDYTATLNENGELISENIEPASRYIYRFDDETYVHSFTKIDSNGDEIWVNDLPTNLGLSGDFTFSRSSHKTIDDRVLFFGTMGDWQSDFIDGASFVFFVELDSDGNLINYIETSFPFLSTVADVDLNVSNSHPLIFNFNFINEKAVLIFRLGDNDYHIATTDLNTNQLTVETFTPLNSGKILSSFSEDGNTLLVLNIDNDIKLINFEDGTTTFLPASIANRDFGNYEAVGAMYDVLLLANGDFLLTYNAKFNDFVYPYDQMYARFNSEGILLWDRKFKYLSPNLGNVRYIPQMETNSGNLIFRSGLSILKFTPDGELLNCDENGAVICDFKVSGGPEQINLDNIVGNNISVSVINENQEVIWSCGGANDSDCSGPLTVDVPVGTYTVIIQSASCDFSEQIIVGKEDCSFLATYASPFDILFGNLDNWQMTQNEDNTIDIWQQVFYSSNSYTINFDITGNQLSTSGTETVAYLYDFDSGNATHHFIAEDAAGNVIWETEVPLQFNQAGFTTTDSHEFARFIEKDGRLIALGIVSNNINDQIVDPQLFFAEFDLSGNLVNYVETPGNYSVESLAYRTTGTIHWEAQTILTKYYHENNVWRYLKFDLHDMEFKTSQFADDATTHSYQRSWLSQDGKIFYSVSRFEVTNKTYIIDLETGKRITNTIGTCRPENNNWAFVNSLLPLQDGGYLVQSTFSPSNLGYRIARFNRYHEIVWCKTFQDIIGIPYPALETSSGNLLFYISNLLKDEVTVFMTDADGLLSCDVEETCNITLSSTNGQININGLVGEDININVFNANQELVWSCNWWTGNDCSEMHNIDLPAGNYAVAAQSSLCNFYEFMEIPAEMPGNIQNRIVVQNIYPNPVIDELNLQIDANYNANCIFQIMDSRGKIINAQNDIMVEGFNHFIFSTTHLPTGIYYLILLNEYGEQSTFKFVKEE